MEGMPAARLSAASGATGKVGLGGQASKSGGNAGAGAGWQSLEWLKVLRAWALLLAQATARRWRPWLPPHTPLQPLPRPSHGLTLDGVQLVLPCEHKAVAVVLARCVHKVEGEELEPLLAAVLALENFDLQ